MIRKGIIGVSGLTPVNLHGPDDDIVWTGTARELIDFQPDGTTVIEPACVSAIVGHRYVALGDGYGVSPVKVTLGDMAP